MFLYIYIYIYTHTHTHTLNCAYTLLNVKWKSWEKWKDSWWRYVSECTAMCCQDCALLGTEVSGIGLVVRSYAHAWCSWTSYVNLNRGFFSFWVCFLIIMLCSWKDWISNFPRCLFFCLSLRNVLKSQRFP